MKLADYLLSERGLRAQLANKLGCSPQYLWQLSSGWKGRRPSVAMALKIEKATRGKVRVVDLIPELSRRA
jgi:DNA-binding transcriptional regulator YdaS (Cro superfamily)